MKRKTLFTAILCALLAVTLLGCGTSNKLQSIELTLDEENTTGGFFNLVGISGTLQLKAIGHYTSTKTHDLTNVVTYTVEPIGTDVGGTPLNPPPLTVTINPTGMLTAVEPAVCTWENLGDETNPAWVLDGYYKVTATFDGITSQPVSVAVASAAGNGPPAGACGPS